MHPEIHGRTCCIYPNVVVMWVRTAVSPDRGNLLQTLKPLRSRLSQFSS